MDLNILEYMKEYNKKAYGEYENYLKRNDIKVGDTVMTLVAGFGGLDGLILTVKSIDKKQIKIIDNAKRVYACNTSNWWKTLVVIDNDNISKDRMDYYDRTGKFEYLK